MKIGPGLAMVVSSYGPSLPIRHSGGFFFPRMAIMALSELSRHNAIGNDTRQRQTGWALRVRRALQPAQLPQEQPALSNEVRNLRQIRHVAVELVEHLHRDLSPLTQLRLITALEQQAWMRYEDRLKGELVSADVVEAWVGSLRVAGTGG
jgi:hypothetical protein